MHKKIQINCKKDDGIYIVKYGFNSLQVKIYFICVLIFQNKY